MRRAIRLAAAVAALAIGGLVPSAHAQILFDPDSTLMPINPAVLVNTFDYDVGNALAQGSLVPGGGGMVANTPFQLYFQAVLTNLGVPTGQVIPPGFPGAGSPVPNPYTPLGLNGNPPLPGIPAFEITTVVRFTELATGSTATTAVFTLQPDAPPGSSFVEIYYDDLTDGIGTAADNLAGTGFNDGVLILSATPRPDLPNASNFTATSLVAEPFDQNGANNYPGITSIRGTGSTSFFSSVDYVNTNFFLNPLTPGVVFSTTLITTTQAAPFNQQNPSATFLAGENPQTAGTGGAKGPFGSGPAPGITPNVTNGAATGTNGVDGPDFQFEADASQSFRLAVVPEPGTISLAATGAGLLSLAALRRRRARSS